MKNIDNEEEIRRNEIRKHLRQMAVERYGFSLSHNFNKDRAKWESLSHTGNAIQGTNAPIEVFKEALDTAMRHSPDFFPRTQKILNEICAIQTRILKENKGEDKTYNNATDENLTREKLKAQYVKKIGLTNVLKAQDDYIKKTNLPNSPFFLNAIWGGLNRQEQDAVDIIASYEEKPT